MADNTTIIANTENIENVVITFSKQLEDYVNKMNDEVAKLKGAVVSLKTGWDAGDYNSFAQSMDQKIQSINHELEASLKLKDYLNDVATQLKDFLDTLRAAGGNN